MTVIILSDDEQVCIVKDVNKTVLILESGTESDNDNDSDDSEKLNVKESGCRIDENYIQNEKQDEEDDNKKSNSHDENDDNNNNNNCDDDEKIRQRMIREEQESIELARQLMAEEAMLSYHQHFQYLQESANDLSTEDYEALARALRDETDSVNDESDNNNNNNNNNVVRTNTGFYYDEEEEEVGNDGINVHVDDDGHDSDNYDDDDDSDNDWSYEAMLTLGERIGDVKTERWTMIAAQEIEKLPSFYYTSNAALQSTCDDDSNDNNVSQQQQQVAVAACDDSEIKCLICQTNYENDDHLLRLPCNHCFHKDCVSQWLSEKDVCPYCRTCIVPN